jgi:hypothetical protein
MGCTGGHGLQRWHDRRAVPIVHAIDAVLEHMVERAEGPVADRAELAEWELPLSTGIDAVDRVLAGGVHRGTVALLEVDLPAQAAALAFTVARRAPHRRMLDVEDVTDATEWLMAGAAGVPRVHIGMHDLSRRDWDAVSLGLDALGGQELSVSSTGSLASLEAVVMASCADVVVVHRAERFGSPSRFLTGLAAAAIATDCAVVATTDPLGEVPEWALENVTRLAVVDFELGGRACVARPDREALLAIAHLQVECLTGAVLVDG